MSHLNNDGNVPMEPTGGRSVAQGLGTYGGLTSEALEVVAACAERIRAAVENETKLVFSIGRELVEAKRHLRHGHFGTWLDREFGWSERTAQRYMQAVEKLGTKADTVSVLPPTAIYALSAKSTPKAVRDEVVARVQAGEKPNLREVQAKVTAARKAEQAERADMRADMRAARDLTQPLPAVVRIQGRVAAQQAANFILEKLGEDRTALERLLKGVEPKALVEALCKGEVVDTAAPISTITL